MRDIFLASLMFIISWILADFVWKLCVDDDGRSFSRGSHLSPFDPFPLSSFPSSIPVSVLFITSFILPFHHCRVFTFPLSFSSRLHSLVQVAYHPRDDVSVYHSDRLVLHVCYSYERVCVPGISFLLLCSSTNQFSHDKCKCVYIICAREWTNEISSATTQTQHPLRRWRIIAILFYEPETDLFTQIGLI